MSTRPLPGFSPIRLRVSGFVSRSLVHLKWSFALRPSSNVYGAERAVQLPDIHSTQSPATLETKAKFHQVVPLALRQDYGIESLKS